MKFALIACLCFIPTLVATAKPAATQPVAFTLHQHDVPAHIVLDVLAKEAGAPFPLSPPDLLEKNPVPPITIDLDRKPFWTALEEFSHKTGLEPVLTPDDPYPRFQLGLGGGVWEEPHVVAGAGGLFGQEGERTQINELHKKKHTFYPEFVL